MSWRFWAVLVGMTVFAGTPDKGPTVQATVLDHNEFTCSGCLFGVSDYYYCFDAGDKTLIGHQKVRTQTKQFAPPELMKAGTSVPIRFDAQYIWVPQVDRKSKVKDLRLTQDYTKKIFLNSDRCQAAVK